MVTKELVDYIRDQLQLSIGEIIRENLRRHGWKEEDIDDAFRQALLKTPYAAAPMPKKRSHKKLFVIIIAVLVFIPLMFGTYAYFFLPASPAGRPDSPIHSLLKQREETKQSKDNTQATAPTPVSEPTPSAPSEGFADIFAKVRDTQRKADLSKIATALEAYFSENNSYPDSLDALSLDALSTKDPQTEKDYKYTKKDNGQNYELCAEFETLGRKCVSSTVKVSDLQ